MRYRFLYSIPRSPGAQSGTWPRDGLLQTFNGRIRDLIERMGASLSTVRRMEKGDLRVPIHFFARALHVFGEVQALEHLLDTPNDEIGLTLMDERLPDEDGQPI